MTERMECPECGYKCTPQWLNDQAHCLKCQAVLRRRAKGAGTGAGTAVTDFARRQVGEASTYKNAGPGGSAREIEGAMGCSKSPNGQHMYKFGKCSHCAQPEPPTAARAKASAAPAAAAPAASSGAMKATPSKKCTKCMQPYGGHGDVCAGCRGFAKTKGSSKQCSQCGGFYWGFADVCEDCEGGSSAAAAAAKKAPAPKRDERTKVECPHCGYKCVPQWLNDQAHCLKCQAVLKVQETVHGVAGGKMPNGLPRQAGEVSTFKHSAGSAMESESGVCSKSPTGSHHWKFGKCEFCGKAEGKLAKGAGVAANPGGAGGCDAGGKCVYKFAKCTKCGKREY
mmetsp:Transcript_37451/g.79444  ORF Transcript_37451/g.79444 Transcript_37451/m.79444 type:complete len:339 (+) Transcript_37451:108-1124(+)|eukprot:CAMPEP_0206454580 /NCGR_PEP_ID=MMETSP0324_2-20121206/21220_1 /ASSEMBLY_ACC=CAM_ASM_000836 /TAXON_ID=2866 /ORGANISM="Crypthecodinium cohnii, Strain Seligo" /LENGTH=338 /DNA_ID=CAMNT_0053925077 /DNA_START=101 /DNA_END=1117 /DNA_ORIENTATION=+